MKCFCENGPAGSISSTCPYNISAQIIVIIVVKSVALCRANMIATMIAVDAAVRLTKVECELIKNVL